jgi:hypothetical protein
MVILVNTLTALNIELSNISDRNANLYLFLYNLYMSILSDILLAPQVDPKF